MNKAAQILNIGKHFLSHSQDINQPTAMKPLISEGPAEVPLPNRRPIVHKTKMEDEGETLSHDGRIGSNAIRINPIPAHEITIGTK